MQEGVTPRKRHRTPYMREYRQRRAARRAEAKGELLKFQQEFVNVVERDEDRGGHRDHVVSTRKR